MKKRQYRDNNRNSKLAVDRRHVKRAIINIMSSNGSPVSVATDSIRALLEEYNVRMKLQMKETMEKALERLNR